jgi:uncharacterized protein (DUF1015 family)
MNMAILYPLRALRISEQAERLDDTDFSAELFRTWKESGVIKQDTADAFYICEQEYVRFGQVRKVKSLLCRVKPEGDTKILPVEQAEPAEVSGFLSLLRETSCEFNPVPALYEDDGGKTMSRIDMLSRGKPRFEFVRGGVTCRLWVVNDLLVIRTICEDFENRKLWVAAAYAQFEAARQSGGSVYMMLTDTEQDFSILPYHCILENGADFDGPRFLADCAAYFDIIPREAMSLRVSDEIESNLDALYRQGRKALGFYSGGQDWTLLLLKKHAMDEVLPQSGEVFRSLDCNVLHRLVLEKLLHADRASFIVSAQAAVEAVQTGAGRCAFLISPARKKELFEASAEGEKLPPKSAGFYPPFPAGAVMSPIINT